MKAAVYYENGGPEVLKYEDVPDPTCPPDGVVVRVEAISVEGGDVINRMAEPPPTSPYVVGYQAAGEIVEVGSQVEHLGVGQMVTTVGMSGSHAELRAVPARVAWPVPEGFDVRKAAAIPVAFGTADECLFRAGGLTAGETVLIQAGSGGVGVAAIQLAKRAGATVLATGSSGERLGRLEPLGLDHAINYRDEDVAAAVMRLTDGRGADLVVDPVGGSTLQTSIASLAYRGRVSFVGNAGREPMTVDVWPLLEGNRSLAGVYLAPELAADHVHDTIRRLIDEAARGDLEVVIERTFPLSDAASAHACIESRSAVGRLLSIP